MKRLIATAVLVLMSSLAFALPAPKDIEAAVNAGQLTRAEEMLKEVIRDKPGSAKAHYELGQVLARGGRNIEAREALEKAKSLDPTLKFARDPQHFNDLLNRIPGGGASLGTGSGAALSSPRAEVAMQSAPVHVPAAPAFPWGYVLVGGGVLVAAWMFMRRRAVSGGGPLMAGAGGGMVPAASGSGYAPGYGGGYPPAQPAAGAGIGGAVLGGVAGLAAGYGIAKMMEHGDERSHGSNLAGEGSGFTPIAPSQPDYGSFDAGAGDAWDNADAGSGSDDDSW
jgi:tetratricopeptide (TPR) repeat protein